MMGNVAVPMYVYRRHHSGARARRGLGRPALFGALLGVQVPGPQRGQIFSYECRVAGGLRATSQFDLGPHDPVIAPGAEAVAVGRTELLESCEEDPRVA